MTFGDISDVWQDQADPSLEEEIDDEEQLIEWERQEEQDEFTEACRVVNKNLWLCDDGAP